MGADRVVRVSSTALPGLDPIAIARALASVLGAERPDLVLCGAQSSDAVQGATASALAGLLGLPVVAVVRRIKLSADGAAAAAVHRELEGGLVDVMEVDLNQATRSSRSSTSRSGSLAPCSMWRG